MEYVKEEAKMVYLLECLQKTPPPVSSELRLLRQRDWGQHGHTAALGHSGAGTGDVAVMLQGSAVCGVGVSVSHAPGVSRSWAQSSLCSPQQGGMAFQGGCVGASMQ